MPRGKKANTETTTTAKRGRKVSAETIRGKIATLEKQKASIDEQIAELNAKLAGMEEEEKAQAVIKNALEKMSAVELAKLLEGKVNTEE